LSDRVNWMEEKAKNDLKDEIKFIKPNIIGKDAPMLYLVDTLMKPTVVQTLPADYLVLFFYDPDCGVCKKKTPVLKENYAAIKKLKGEVVAICTITETDKWKKYVKTNELNWVNLADPQYRSNFRMDYNVRSTPQVYIIDKDRKIVAKKLDVEQVVNFLEEHTRLTNLNK
jgi:peroxiredoxin